MVDLSAKHFHDEEAAREHVEASRWPNGAVCPHCVSKKAYKIKAREERSIRKGLYKCGDCKKQFTVTVGTVFERSRVPLNKWLMAIQLMCSSKKGISAKQIERMLGVTYKTAWFMCHRIREAMKDEGGMLGGGGSTVEADETFWSGKKAKNRKQGKKGRGFDHKEKVLTLVERGGRARSFHVQAVNAKTLQPILKEQIAADSRLMTDEAAAYTMTREKLSDSFESHEWVKHGIGEYVRGPVHNNTVESYFAILKRGLNGTFHHVGAQHLKRYVGEFDFRYNHREKLGYNDVERAAELLKGVGGKRLLYSATKRET